MGSHSPAAAPQLSEATGGDSRLHRCRDELKGIDVSAAELAGDLVVERAPSLTPDLGLCDGAFELARQRRVELPFGVLRGRWREVRSGLAAGRRGSRGWRTVAPESGMGAEPLGRRTHLGPETDGIAGQHFGAGGCSCPISGSSSSAESGSHQRGEPVPVALGVRAAVDWSGR